MQYFEGERRLGERLAFYKAYSRKPVFEYKEEKVDQWSAAYFYADVLLNTMIPEDVVVSLERLSELQDRFFSDTGYLVDTGELFKKGWLRYVFGTVCLPKAIRFGPDELGRIKDRKNEILFFEGLSNEQCAQTKTLEQLQLLAEAYQSSHNIIIDLKSAEKKYFTIGGNGQISYNNTRFSAFILQNLPVFEFINIIKALGPKTDLCITATYLKKIHRQHSTFFLKTPSLKELIDKKVFQIDNTDNYTVNFNYNELGLHHDILIKTAGLLWDKLLAQGSYGDAQAKLRFWYYRTVYHSNHYNFLGGLSGKNKQRFLEAAMQIVLAEPDLGTGDEEYHKLRLDAHHAHQENILPEYYTVENVIAQGEDLFENYRQLNELNHGHGSEIIAEQGCRHPITYLISEIVRNDNHFKFKNTLRLLNASTTKTYLFWYTSFMLHHHRPEILPFLITNEDTSALGFRLLFKIDIDRLMEPEMLDIKRQLIEAGFRLLIEMLADSNHIPDSRKATIIFQSLLFTTQKRFKSQQGGNAALFEKYHQHQVIISNRVRELFASAELPAQNYLPQLKYKDLLYPELLDELFKKIQAIPPDDWGNRLIYLPYAKLDQLVFIAELSLRKDQKGEMVASGQQTSQYISGFLQSYLEAINCKEVMELDYSDVGRKLKPSQPSWITNHAQDKEIDWAMMFLHLEKYFIFEDFLSPLGLTFSASDDKYNEYNHFTADKLRNHIAVLIIGFNGVLKKAKQAKITGLPVTGVLSKIENKLTHLITRYSLFDPAQGRYDIFNERLERWHFGGTRSELLPIIGSVINRFTKENRQSIVRELIKSDQLIRSLKMIGYIVSEDEKKKLLNIVVNEQDIQKTMDDLSYADKQFVIQSLTANPEFIKQAEQALVVTDEPNKRRRISYQKNEDEVYHFRARLLLAYHNNDIEAVKTIVEPEFEMYLGNNFTASQEKLFYEGLIYLHRKESEESHSIFNELLSFATEDKPTFALNRFAAHIDWAAQTTDGTERQRRYIDALAEWDSYEHSSDKQAGWNHISEKVIFNKLEALEALGEDERFDQLYQPLETDIKLKPHFLEVRITNLVRRQMQLQAEQLLSEAKNIHALETGGYPLFIAILENLTNTPETIAFLTQQHNRILALPADKLIEVVTGNGVGAKDISGFLLDEIMEAANQMLFKINAVSEVGHEDKYSDLLMMVLNSRLQHFHWSVETLRGGFSDRELEAQVVSTKAKDKQSNVGEIDFGIYSATHELLAICEALILEGKNTIEVQKHNLKIFNYEPSRKLFFLISYYRGAVENYVDAWKSYIGVVENFIEFPSGHQITGGKLTEINHPKGNASLKITTSTHGETTLYHVFININYQVKNKKKTVRSSKKDTAK
jgi:uncharacterized protein YlbG (UPF0298 family)